MSHGARKVEQYMTVYEAVCVRRQPLVLLDDKPRGGLSDP